MIVRGRIIDSICYCAEEYRAFWLMETRVIYVLNGLGKGSTLGHIEYELDVVERLPSAPDEGILLTEIKK